MNHFEIRLPMSISDETAYAPRTLLNQLTYDFECTCFSQIHRHSQWLQQAEGSDRLLENQPLSDDLPF